jgi:hypothetical protein
MAVIDSPSSGVLRIPDLNILQRSKGGNEETMSGQKDAVYSKIILSMN